MKKTSFLIERMDLFYHNRYMERPMCINCRHFCRYYIRKNRRYFPIDAGMCMHSERTGCNAWEICSDFTPQAASSPAPEQTK